MPKAAPPKPPGEDAKRDGAKAGAKKRRGESAFDVWLQRGLHKMYDDVASEPIPDELLRLIEADRKK